MSEFWILKILRMLETTEWAYHEDSNVTKRGKGKLYLTEHDIHTFLTGTTKVFTFSKWLFGDIIFGWETCIQMCLP